MRQEVLELLTMGALPDSSAAADDVLRLEEYQRLLGSITKPVSDEEAAALLGLFGPDDCFGLAWALVHLVESAPGWPLLDRLAGLDSEWVTLLVERAANGH
jgi:hypothetical protein